MIVSGRHMTDMEVIALLRRIGKYANELSDCDYPNSCYGDCHGCAIKAISTIVRNELEKFSAIK